MKDRSPGAIILIAASIILAFFTLGIALVITWPVAILWGTIVASNQHSAFERGLHQSTAIDPLERIKEIRAHERWNSKDNDH